MGVGGKGACHKPSAGSSDVALVDVQVEWLGTLSVHPSVQERRPSHDSVRKNNILETERFLDAFRPRCNPRCK